MEINIYQPYGAVNPKVTTIWLVIIIIIVVVVVVVVVFVAVVVVCGGGVALTRQPPHPDFHRESGCTPTGLIH